MILDCHLTICLLHLVIGSFRSDLENAIVAVIAWTELREDGIYLTLRESYIRSYDLKYINLTLVQTITCSKGYKVVIQLQTLRLVHA